jgi:hypothetical protein
MRFSLLTSYNSSFASNTRTLSSRALLFGQELLQELLLARSDTLSLRWPGSELSTELATHAVDFFLGLRLGLKVSQQELGRNDDVCRPFQGQVLDCLADSFIDGVVHSEFNLGFEVFHPLVESGEQKVLGEAEVAVGRQSEGLWGLLINSEMSLSQGH